MKKVLMAYSSNTGNTKDLSQYIYEKIKQDCDVTLLNQKDVKDFDYDVIFVGMWVSKFDVDKQTKKFIKNIPSNVPVVVYGTSGGSHVHQKHHILDNKIADAFKNVNFQESKLTFGKIDESLTKKVHSIIGNLLPKSIKDEIQHLSEISRDATEEEKDEVVSFLQKYL